MAGTLTITAEIDGLAFGAETVGPLNITSTAPVGAVSLLALAAGANTIAVPAGATAAVICPSAGSTSALVLKGVSGDTGVPLAPAGPSLWNLAGATAPATFVLNAAAAAVVTILWL